MSFKCGVTGKTVFGERQTKVVIEKRQKVYTDEEGNEVGRGFETVKEIAVSEEGLRQLNASANMAQLDQVAAE